MLLAREGNQLFERRQVRLGEEQLAGIRTRVGRDRHRLAPEEFRPAAGEPAPATDGQFVGRALERAVTALHRVDPEAVAHRAAADLDRCQRRRNLGLEADLHAEPGNLCFERFPICENRSAHARVTRCMFTITPTMPGRGERSPPDRKRRLSIAALRPKINTTHRHRSAGVGDISSCVLLRPPCNLVVRTTPRWNRRI